MNEYTTIVFVRVFTMHAVIVEEGRLGKTMNYLMLAIFNCLVLLVGQLAYMDFVFECSSPIFFISLRVCSKKPLPLPILLLFSSVYHCRLYRLKIKVMK